MNLIESLYHTYNNCVSHVGVEEEGGSDTLLPLSHTTQNANIEVTLDHQSNFVSAKIIPKRQQKTIVPCTEQSGGRAGSKPTSHPLCDKLQYLAGDFLEYGGCVTSGYAANPSEPHTDYLNLLDKWQNSHPHPKVKIVHEYVKKARLVRDLVLHKIIPLTHSDSGIGNFLDEWNDKESEPPEVFASLPATSTPQESFIRWRVTIPGDPSSNLWEDPSVWECWSEHYKTTQEITGLCYVTGKNQPLAIQHPAKLRHAADKAKLISSNDGSGFTFRGRFTDPSGIEAASVSFDVTQKAHNALRWLISKQGTRLGEQAVVAWSLNNQEIPNPLDSSLELATVQLEEDDIDAILEQEHKAHIVFIDQINTGQSIALALKQKLLGYRKALGDTNKILVLSLDSATPGRMAITYFRELTASEFMDRIEKWHDSTSWLLYHNKGRKYLGAPSPHEIAQAAYGFGSRLDDKLKSATYRRLLPCIIDARPIPDDLVISCIQRASARISHEDWEWEKILGIACALYRKQQFQKNNKTNYTMSLDPERNTRSYLYGRLLAVADVLEQAALARDENRPTNAARMMQRYSSRPFDTWPILYQRLEPYIRRLKSNKPGLLHRYQIELDAIKDLFHPEDFINDNKLDGEYLLGYHCQRSALYTKNSKDLNTEETDTNTDEHQEESPN
jgi:CRISPR-associated protein Csd1